jgi:hypothetical protein
MATVLDECTAEDQLSVVSFQWAKVFNEKEIHKEIFPVYVGKCFLRKAVHNWVKEIVSRTFESHR